jgi:hypothetical protein
MAKRVVCSEIHTKKEHKFHVIQMQKIAMSNLVVHIVTGRLEMVKGTLQFKAHFPRERFSSCPRYIGSNSTLVSPEARDAISAGLLCAKVPAPHRG